MESRDTTTSPSRLRTALSNAAKSHPSSNREGRLKAPIKQEHARFQEAIGLEKTVGATPGQAQKLIDTRDKFNKGTLNEDLPETDNTITPDNP